MTKKDEKGRIILGDNMISKDKKVKHIRITLKRIIGFLALILIILYCIIFYNYYLNKNEVYAKETNANIVNEFKLSNAEKINLDEIIESNTKNNKKEEYITEEIDLEYITKYQTNSNLPKGTIQVIQEGREGKQEIVKRRIYENEQMISEEQISSKVTIASVSKIVEVGAGNYISTYKVKQGDTVYVTSDRINVMVEPNMEAQKIATLNKADNLKVLALQGDWYKISSSGIVGYVKTENTT